MDHQTLKSSDSMQFVPVLYRDPPPWSVHIGILDKYGKKDWRVHS